MTYRVVFRPQAAADLRSIYRYVARTAGVAVAGGYLKRIEETCLSLGTFPLRGTPRDTLGPGLRQIGFERRATIIFRVQADMVEIVAVAHAGKDIARLFGADE